MPTALFPNFSEGFLFDEDKALRRLIMGMTVHDDATKVRQVGVWFAHPDNEIREQKYPYAVISLIDISRADNRLHSGEMPVGSLPLSWLSEKLNIQLVENEDGTSSIYNAAGLWSDVWSDPPSVPLRFTGPPPVPVQIDYQVRCFSRHPRHSREIILQMIGRKVPYTYGHLDMSDVDGSNRRLELLDVAHGESIEASKRLLVSVFTVRVDGFMPMDDGLITVYEDQFVTDIYLDLWAMRRGDDSRPLIQDHESIPQTAFHFTDDGWSTYDRPSHYQLPQHQLEGVS